MVVPSGLVIWDVGHGPFALALVVKIADVSPLVSTDQFVQPILFVAR
jgi:hypothetical protein